MLKDTTQAKQLLIPEKISKIENEGHTDGSITD